MTQERQELVDALFGTSTPCAIAAVHSLAIPGDSHALSMLMNRVNQAPAELALAIINELINLADSRAIPALVSCLRSDQEMIRGEALYGIIALSEQRATSLPHDLLQKDDPQNPSRALTQIIYPADLEALKILDTHLRDQDPELRIGAAYGLGAMRAKNAVRSLGSLALNDEDEDVRAAATYALGQLVESGSTEALMLLEQSAEASDHAETLIAATRTLCFYRPEAHITIFMKCVNQKDDRLRQLGFLGLGLSGSPSVLTCLERGLADRSTHIQRIAAQAMGEIKDASSIEPLIMAAARGSAELRAAVSDALKKFDDHTVDQVLLRAAKSNSPAIRKVTSYIAAKNGRLTLCASLLTDLDESVRKQATLGLSDLHRFDPESVLASAFRALTDPSWKVRVASIEALSRIGDKKAIQRLESIRDDENHVVKQAIRRTLAKF